MEKLASFQPLSAMNLRSELIGRRYIMSQASQVTLDRLKKRLNEISTGVRESFAGTHDAREQALRIAREVIRNSANSIRATHRGEFDQAREMIVDITTLVRDMDVILGEHPSVYHAGFVEDAQKEYVEACATLAFAAGSELARPEELNVGPAAYMNGLAEAVGELRRFILDSLRRDEFSRCEELLEVMDDVYTMLVSMDFPDAITRGLRRNTDMVRGVLERTRGDLTVALRQRRLEQKLVDFNETLERGM